MPIQPVIQKDIAKACGFTTATVSMALRDDHRIPEATREKIKRMAAKLGYRPDPALSALAAYRSRNRPTGKRETIGILNAWPMENSLPAFFQEHVDYACERADQLGYETELFSVPDSGKEQARLSRMLDARNVRGLLVGPVPVDRPEVHLDWRRFSATTIGYSLRFPELHFAASNHLQTVETAYNLLESRGYRRIGYCSTASMEQRNRHLYACGYLKCLLVRGIAQSDRPPLIEEDISKSQFEEWMNRWQFDAIIIRHFSWLPDIAMRSSKSSIPFGIVTIGHSHPYYSGIAEDWRGVGIAAMNLLHQMLLIGERGIPEHRRSVQIDGIWEDRGSAQEISSFR